MEFYRLTEAIEAQGGAHLDLLHEPKRVKIPVPDAFKGKGSAQTHDEKGRPLVTTGCYEGTMFTVDYRKPTFGGDPSTDQLYEVGKKDDGSDAFMANPVDDETDSLVVCAKCDCVGLWPRFKGEWEEEEE